MKLLQALAASALALPTIATIAWFGFPEATAEILIDANNASAGLSEKTVQTQIGPIGYLEGGEGETVVLIHGIFSRKEHWVEVARRLVDDYHVIALDLPGFGDNSPLSDNLYGLMAQQRNLSLVFDALDLEHVHVGANSMGAYVTGLLAHEEPGLFRSIAYIGSPLGVPSPVRSDMEIALASGEIPLLVQTKEQFADRGAWLSPNTLAVPSPILKTWRNAELAQADKNERIWHSVHDFEGIPSMIDLAPSLHMPLLILWCREDRIFHVSGATELAGALPNAQAEILNDCGHVPMIDQPEQVAALYSEFLSQLPE